MSRTTDIAWPVRTERLSIRPATRDDAEATWEYRRVPWAQAEVKDKAKGMQAELGWCLRPEEEGKGLATEAVVELFRICFEDLGLRRVVANCFSANEPSWRLMERVGMRREEHAVKDSLHRNGEWMDGYRYALLADEWQARADG
jgi:RimJ/RimL family protein N-acetyltransferase